MPVVLMLLLFLLSQYRDKQVRQQFYTWVKRQRGTVKSLDKIESLFPRTAKYRGKWIDADGNLQTKHFDALTADSETFKLNNK